MASISITNTTDYTTWDLVRTGTASANQGIYSPDLYATMWDITDSYHAIKELQREVTELRALLTLSPEDLAAIRELKQLKELIMELGFEKLLMEGAE